MNRILTASIASVLMTAPALAGEFGVKNSYSYNIRHGQGKQTVEQVSHSQLKENGHTSAVKVVRGSFTDGKGYQDEFFSITKSSGNSSFGEAGKVKVSGSEKYTFTGGSFSHGTGSYFNN